MTPIYLDHAATTSVRPEVFEAMRPFLMESFGNPSSVHRYGRSARERLEEAREKVAAALGAERREIVFTSGGTEADNLAVLGGVRALGGGRVRTIISAVEHKAVLSAAKQNAAEGAELVILGVDLNGTVDLAALEHALPARSAAGPPSHCAVLWGSNEVGTVQPVVEIAERCAAAGVVFHTDAVQAFGRVPVRVDRVACSTLALSGHKIGAPKGVGALFVRRGTPIEPLVHGGGQEFALRPGTENVAAIVGLGVAADLAVRELAQESVRLQTLRDRLQNAILARVPDAVVNAESAQRLPHILNVSFPNVDLEALLISLDLEGVAVSSGSACQSGSVTPSHVLTAMGRGSPEDAAIRISLGRTTTDAEINTVAQILPDVVDRVRQARPSLIGAS